MVTSNVYIVTITIKLEPIDEVKQTNQGEPEKNKPQSDIDLSAITEPLRTN